MCRAAAANADRMHFRDFFRDREECRHRAERPAHVVLIETGGDDPDPGVGELHADLDHSGIEELNLVDAYDLDADLDAREELATAGDRNCLEPALITRHDVFG